MQMCTDFLFGYTVDELKPNVTNLYENLCLKEGLPSNRVLVSRQSEHILSVLNDF